MLSRFKQFSIFLLLLAAAACSRSKPTGESSALATVPDSPYVSIGERIAAAAADTLRQSLLSAIGSGGFASAISFCNEHAKSLTEVTSDSVVIKRTSIRFRNPENKPDDVAREVLKEWEEELQQSKRIEARLIRRKSEGEIHFFKPIMMQAMCLNCHGQVDKNIQPPTLARIREKYPDDLAINFQEGDLRGAWQIVFQEMK